MRSFSQGIGMTSQRTRDRLVERLRSKGIQNNAVLEAVGSTPRHLFVDEAFGYGSLNKILSHCFVNHFFGDRSSHDIFCD